jgi:subtilisin-like proprotein convertase family protein
MMAGENEPNLSHLAGAATARPLAHRHRCFFGLSYPSFKDRGEYMNPLTCLSSQLKGQMIAALCFVTIIALLAIPLPKAAAQDSVSSTEKGYANIEAPAVSFNNPAPVSPVDRPNNNAGSNPGLPTLYPSTINVSGLPLSISKVTVTFAVTSTFPDDLDVLLVGPTGARSLVMSDAGGSGDPVNVTYTFDQSAPTTMPDAPTTIVPAGTFQPSNFTGLATTEPAGNDNFPAPGPGVLAYPTTFNVFNGTNPNGVWSLYVVDDQNIDNVSLPSGWSIDITAGAPSELLYTTNGSSISRFNHDALGVVTTVPVTGLQAGETLVDIDVRPQNSQLYGVGSSSRLYTINPITGVATPVGAAGAFTINGTAFGTDFNPNADRLRLVSNTEQNIRLNPNDGSLAATDTALTPAGNVVSAAYDRNDLSIATATTLYAIDSAAGTLVTIGGIDGSPSPNSGLITTVGTLGLGTNLNEPIGFDISASTGIGFASITTAGISRLYTINLSTGSATLSSSNGGSIGGGSSPFVGLTVAKAPLAGEVSISGRVTAGERGITNARVTVSGGSLAQPIVAVTGRNGAYVVSGLTAGETYLVTVSARRFTFEEPSRVITLNDNLSGIDFNAQAPDTR